MRKRVFASVLAGTMALSVPMTVGAKNVNEGGAIAGGSLPNGTNAYFDVVLPTNAVSNANFIIDPQNKLASGLVPNVNKNAYDQDENVLLYFQRKDFDQVWLGRPEKQASTIWGDVKNVKGTYVWGNDSNWMVVKNKSSGSVVVELSATWQRLDDAITVVTKEADLAKTQGPAIYMEVQASTGYTDGVLKGATHTGDTVGDRLLPKAYDRIVDEKTPLKELTLVTADRNGIPTVGDGDKTVWLTYYIPTVNQNYFTSDEKYIVDYEDIDVTMTDLNDEAFIIMATTDATDSSYVTGYELKDNRTKVVPGKPDNLNAYDENYDVYPTYGFRLHGNVNASSDWYKVSAPQLGLKWKVTMAEMESLKDVPLPTLDYDEININGVIDDTQSVNFQYNDSGAVLDSIVWVKDNGEEMELWNKQTQGTLINPDEYGDENFKVEAVTVDSKLNAAGEPVAMTWIREIMLIGWSNNEYFVGGQEAGVNVEFRYTIDGEAGKPLTLHIYDSENGVH